MMDTLSSPCHWYKPNRLTASFCSTHHRWSPMLRRAVNRMTRHAWPKSKMATLQRPFVLLATSGDQPWTARLCPLKSFLRSISCVCGHRAPKFSTRELKKVRLCLQSLLHCPMISLTTLVCIIHGEIFNFPPAGGLVAGSQHSSG